MASVYLHEQLSGTIFDPVDLRLEEKLPMCVGVLPTNDAQEENVELYSKRELRQITM